MGATAPGCRSMNGPRVALVGSQHSNLTKFLDGHPDKHERAAIVLLKRIHVSVESLKDSDRYVVVEVIPFEDSWVTSDSDSHVAFNLAPLRYYFRRCEEEGLVFGFVHNHPLGGEEFSDTDEENERAIFSALRNRNGLDVSFVSLLWASGKWQGRVRYGANQNESFPLRHVLVLSEKMNLSVVSSGSELDSDIYARQEAAFGRPFVEKLRSLRVCIVGCGGTGSAVATLLARVGVGELVLIDCDDIESTNLNRLRGAGVTDVGNKKALVLKEYISSLGLATTVAAIDAEVDGDPAAVDALAISDVVFGCTDDQIGRELINVALYVYCLACIDLGLGGKISEDREGLPILSHHHARLSTILPESGECLFCQGVISQEWIQHQYALRENPLMSEGEAKEKYLTGGGEEAPGVAPFTGAAADFAVANLFELLRSFRRLPGSLRYDAYSLDFVNMELRSTAALMDSSCPYCGSRSFLNIRETTRLNRPILGKRDEAF